MFIRVRQPTLNVLLPKMQLNGFIANQRYQYFSYVSSLVTGILEHVMEFWNFRFHVSQHNIVPSMIIKLNFTNTYLLTLLQSTDIVQGVCGGQFKTNIQIVIYFYGLGKIYH